MTTFVFQSDIAKRHQAFKRGDRVLVDGIETPIRALDDTHYAIKTSLGTAHVRVAARGNTFYVQMNGRSCTIERVDPTRSDSRGAGTDQGSATAPMPGVVVSWAAQPGSAVKAGEALLVIESMKLQMTIGAPRDGRLDELPFQPGQTFQRGAVLARIHAVGAAV